MRFFDQQADARTRSRHLSCGFALAVVCTALGMNLALSAPWVLWRLLGGAPIGYPLGFVPVNIGGTLLLILGGWWIESSNCSHGQRLAERLGARRAQPATRFDEQRLCNIVSEICIAARMPQPAVMVLMRHPGINAFVTGITPADWAITVTEGALQHLTRAELQGLVAHECSHLKEGDTALNMRLLGMLTGLEMVWGLGRSLLPDHDLEGNSRIGLLTLPRLVFGASIMAVGWLGWLSGRLLQAAISREREHLADARAVQWTRLADGLGSALRKILAQQQQAASHAHRRTPLRLSLAAHMFLVADDGQWPIPDNPRTQGHLGRLIATHPPLAERIRRIYGRPRGPLPLPRIHPRTGLPVQQEQPHGW